LAEKQAPDAFLSELKKRAEWVYDYLRSNRYVGRFPEGHVRDAVYRYVDSCGKCLRPAVLLFSCGAVGGDETKALPAAAGIEVFHTWTLVHDDIIDRDDRRRGKATVHAEFAARAETDLALRGTEAEHYGTTVAILTGDIQHGWAVSLFSELSAQHGVDPAISLYLVNCLNSEVLNRVMQGEMSDVQNSKASIDELQEAVILETIRMKTGALYQFAGKAGAMIGLNTSDPRHKWVRAVSAFAEQCGAAFQLQDDILGIVGDEQRLGKPVGSDIREGKRTTIVYFALRNANSTERNRLKELLDNEVTTDDRVDEAVRLLADLGGIDETKRLAERFVADSLRHLDKLPPSPYRDLMSSLAEYVICRDF